MPVAGAAVQIWDPVEQVVHQRSMVEQAEVLNQEMSTV
jgi:hypothetical protein